MPHDHAHNHHHHHHGPGHNHDHADHMHSHMHEVDDAAELQVLTEQFIDGFTGAKDKMSSFGSRELSYMPYPGEMVTERTNMDFIYVSLDAKQVTDLRSFLQNHPASGKDYI